MNVLFIGNSFTSRNDLPGLVARLAEAAGDHLDHQLISRGGASLRMHLNKGDALALMSRTRFDYVVLQEQSTLPIKSAKRMHESVREFDKAIKESGAKTGLYMTWARAHSPQNQTAITDAYTIIARELDATLIPAGLAWQRFLAKHDRPVLHDRDQSHPTLAGSYLSACVAFAALFNRSLKGLSVTVPGLTLEEQALLQDAASSVMSRRS
jgi:hypothetical protein